MLKAWIEFIMSVLKAIFKLKDSSVQEQQEDLQEHQEHLQEQYNDIDDQHQVDPDISLQDVEDKLNDRF